MGSEKVLVECCRLASQRTPTLAGNFLGYCLASPFFPYHTAPLVISNGEACVIFVLRCYFSDVEGKESLRLKFQISCNPTRYFFATLQQKPNQSTRKPGCNSFDCHYAKTFPLRVPPYFFSFCGFSYTLPVLVSCAYAHNSVTQFLPLSNRSFG